jgi:hypothetical protein
MWSGEGAPEPITIGVCVTVCVTTDPDFVITSTVVLGVGVGELDVRDELETGALETGFDDGDGVCENRESAQFCYRSSDMNAISDDV